MGGGVLGVLWRLRPYGAGIGTGLKVQDSGYRGQDVGHTACAGWGGRTPSAPTHLDSFAAEKSDSTERVPPIGSTGRKKAGFGAENGGENGVLEGSEIVDFWGRRGTITVSYGSDGSGRKSLCQDDLKWKRRNGYGRRQRTTRTARPGAV